MNPNDLELKCNGFSKDTLTKQCCASQCWWWLYQTQLYSSFSVVVTVFSYRDGWGLTGTIIKGLSWEYIGDGSLKNDEVKQSFFPSYLNKIWTMPKHLIFEVNSDLPCLLENRQTIMNLRKVDLFYMWSFGQTTDFKMKSIETTSQLRNNF